MTEARCIRECIWQGRRWKPGETYRGAETPPEHFRPLDSAAPDSPDPYEDKKPRSRRKRTPPAEAEDRDDAPEAGETEKEE